jgi:hypothetical protein
LPASFSEDATRFSNALGFRLVSLDSIARLVRFRSLDLFQLIGTLEQKAGMSSVSSAAHLGGAEVGLAAWLVWRKPNDESRMLE